MQNNYKKIDVGVPTSGEGGAKDGFLWLPLEESRIIGLTCSDDTNKK